MKHNMNSAAHAPVRGRTRLVALAAGAALGLSALVGCAAGQISQTVDQVPNIDSVQGLVGDVGVRDAIIAMPDGPNYPAGSDAALSFWVTNSGDAADTLTAVSTDAGPVAVNGDATVPAYGRIAIGTADADVSAVITGLTRDLNYGFSVPITFSFAHAGDITLRVPIEVPQEREADRPSLNIYGEEWDTIWDE